MSFDQYLNNPDNLIDEVIENAKSDANENPAAESGPEDDFSDFTTKNPYEDAEILDEQINREKTETGTTATVQDFSENDNHYQDLSDQDKKRNFLYCQLYILMISEGAEMVCKLIGGEFGEDIGNKYAISKIKQNDMARAWAEVLNMEMKTKSPKNALGFMVFASILPLVILALKTRFSKRAEKKKEAEQKYRQEVKEVQAEIIEDTINEKKPEQAPTFTPIDEKMTAEVRTDKTESPIPPPEIVKTTKKKRGRKRGSAKNPKTGKSELFTGIIYENGKPYFQYSWGEKKIIPKSYRDEFLKGLKK